MKVTSRWFCNHTYTERSTLVLNNQNVDCISNWQFWTNIENWHINIGKQWLPNSTRSYSPTPLSGRTNIHLLDSGIVCGYSLRGRIKMGSTATFKTKALDLLSFFQIFVQNCSIYNPKFVVLNSLLCFELICFIGCFNARSLCLFTVNNGCFVLFF